MGHTLVWSGAIGALVGYDVLCARRGDGSTFSSCVRAQLTSTERQILFVGSWAVLTAWFVPHILMPLYQEIQDLDSGPPLPG